MLSSASGTMSNNGSYGNERFATNIEPEFAIDPASGGFFHGDNKKHDDLKEMLDSNKDSLKLEAMKRIIVLVAKGRNASDLFPAVVKNVVSKNIEVNKLVNLYLIRYAEEQQDLVLLSISTSQRALKEPNQLRRAGALRVLSSFRVSTIVPIVMLAIRDASTDMSSYVRKTAAHAIPKLYSLDNEQKPELVSVIQKLLGDSTTLVVGSAVMAFTEVCPERIDLIHKVFRKLCALLADVDEWGQIVIVNVLTRYARTQFADPNLHDDPEEASKTFYDSASDSGSERPSAPTLDPDHRLLLQAAKPLLQSRNAAVVMAVAQLYHHTAPWSEGPLVARALVRLLRSHPEVQSIVLDGIASISVQRRAMFQLFIKSFFIRPTDPTRNKLLKLDILTNLATDANVSIILRELQTYICSNDKNFVAATIQAIGRCACSITSITEACLNGLVSLLSSKDEVIVAESIVVIKRLLQTRAAEPKDIIKRMPQLLDSITVPQARATILWLCGEYSSCVPKIALGVLIKMVKSFCDEDYIVKLQVLNLAVKLYIGNPEQNSKLCECNEHVFDLAYFDQNNDIRDRARLLSHFIKAPTGLITSKAQQIFLASKPAPLLQSHFKDREQLQLGSLSHYINARAVGYEALPPFPKVPPNGDVRNVEPLPVVEPESRRTRTHENNQLFSWESDASAPAESSSEDSSSSDDDSDTESEDEQSDRKPNAKKPEPETKNSDSSDSESDSCSDDDDSSKEDSSDDEDDSPAITNNTSASAKQRHNSSNSRPAEKSNLDLLLDLDDIPSFTPVMTPSLGGFLTPMTNAAAAEQQQQSLSPIQTVSANFVATNGTEILDRITGKGLSITYRFTRNPHLFSPQMVNVNLVFSNSNQDDITDIRIGKKTLSRGMVVHDFASIESLGPSCSLSRSLGIDFNDSTQFAAIEILSSAGKSTISLKPCVGELVRAVTIVEETFTAEQARLRGMNEHSATISTANTLANLSQKMFQVANVATCPCSVPDVLRFAAQTMTSSSLVLITLSALQGQITLTVNCEMIVIGSMLLNELKTILK